MKRHILLVGMIAAVVGFIALPATVHASSKPTATLAMGWDPATCTGTMNGHSIGTAPTFQWTTGQKGSFTIHNDALVDMILTETYSFGSNSHTITRFSMAPSSTRTVTMTATKRGVYEFNGWPARTSCEKSYKYAMFYVNADSAVYDLQRPQSSTATHAALPSDFWPFTLYIVACAILITLFMLQCAWMVFEKAGLPGWKALIPVYSTWLTYKLGEKPGWWTLVLLVPVVNIAALVMLLLAEIEIAKRFGKSSLFGVLALFFFPIVGMPILAFGKATYHVSPSSS